MRTKLYLFIPAIALLVFSCKKDKDTGANPGLNPVNTLEDKIKDSALLYSRDIYLWYSQIPADFKPRNFADPGKIMEAIRPYSKETGFTDPVDRWSFAIKKTEWDNVSAGVAKDFGLNVFFKEEGDLRVRMVERASPAGKAGVRRGWRITKINGSTNIATSNAEAIVNAVYYSDNVTLTLLKPDGNSTDVALSAATYQEHPVALDSIYTTGGKKTGYMVYNSFLGDSLETMTEFQRVFNRFSTANVDDVIIDLRYNGGGYVLYQRELANYLVNNSGNGSLMMKTEYNDKYSRYNSSVNFNKKGTLNLPRIFFIVSKSSASASELLINNLKPYMNVLLVGPTRTYGKPVGYFNIGVGDWYIFPVSSRTTNKNGQGNYYNGFELNSTVADGLDKDWGDTNESCLASALKYIVSGSFRMRTADEYNVNPVIVSTNSRLEPTSFKGLVERQKF